MNNYLIYKLNLIVSLVFLTFAGCSDEELSPMNAYKKDFVEITGAKNSKGSCSATVNFGNLEIETTYNTGVTKNKDYYKACGVDGESWMVKYSDDRVKLQCLKGDGHRTELKESKGDEANLTTQKKMIFTAKYTSLPRNGITIAKIHNRTKGVKRPWLRLYIDSDNKFKIKETKTTPWAKSSTYTTYTGMAYTPNQNVKVTIWTGENGLEKAKIRVDYNGARFEKNLIPTSDWNNYNNGFYLKAGVTNAGTDKEAKVTYSAFQIIH